MIAPLTPIPANEHRLPKWAQARCAAYRRRIQDLERELVALKQGTEPAPFYVEHFDPYTDFQKMNRFYLPKHGRLQHCNANERMRLEFAHEDNGSVKVMCIEGTLSVKPVSGNVIVINGEHW